MINKVSSISPGAKKYIDIGKVTNFMMNDLNKIAFYAFTRPNMYITPPLFVGFAILAAIELKWVAFIVPILVILGLLIQYKITSFVKNFTIRSMTIADKRGKKINEIIKGVKIIKFNAWEVILADQIQKLRHLETHYYRVIFLLKGLASAVVEFLPILIGLVAFPLYDFVYPDNALTIP